MLVKHIKNIAHIRLLQDYRE